MIQIGAPAAAIDSPIEHLMACHRRIEQRLDTLLKAAGHMQDDRASTLAAIGNSIGFLETSGVLHTEDEESSLFPRLRPKLSAGEVAFVDSLEAQHAEAESIFAELKRIVAEMDLQNSVSPATIDQYRGCAEHLQALYQAHIRSEDEILTALAKRSLTGSELVEISAEMRERRSER